MASSQTTSNDSSAEDDKGVKGSVEGRVYEKLSLLLLAKNGYEISKDNAEFRDFSIGREIGLGRDVKFDDNVFRYTDGGTSKNFIFVQVKHIQRDHQIDSRDLSVEATRAKRGRGGGKSREFNLQKYFISYLSVREELKSATSEDYRNGKITYVAIFTNAGLDTEELIRKGFSLEKAPDDIIKLFTLKTQEHKDFYQLSNISKELNEILMKSSDLHRMARALAQYVVWGNHRDKNIMKNDTSPVKHYHVPLAREVIQKSDQVENKSSKKQTKNEEYCEAQFRDEFLENDETGSKQELLNAVFEAIRGLDESKKSFSDDELKKHLIGIKWKIVPNFGETNEKEEISLPSEWKTVKQKDITDFLKCLVLIVNRPKAKDLQALILSSVQDTVVDRHYNTALREIIHKLDNTGPELKEHMEKDLGIYKTTSFQEKWISDEKIVKFLDEQKQQISVSFIVTAMTLLYENEIMQFGKFKESEKMEKCLDNFFRNSAKILCVNTSQTLLSSIKILQYLNSKKTYLAEDGRIYTNSGDLKSKGNRDSVAKAFELERNVLLVIEYRHTVNEQDVEEFYNNLYSVVNDKPNKKIILIIHQDEQNNLLEKFKNNFQKKNNFMLEYDVIDLKYFEPEEDPYKKEVIIFQGQDKRVSLSDITGNDSWTSCVHSFSQEKNQQGVIDGTTLVKILSNDEIEVGSKPAGTSSLDGAYAKMYEEINVETLVNKLVSQEHDNDANDMYIISGISGLNKQDRTNKLIQYLGRYYENEEFKNRLEEFKNRLKTVGVNNLQVFDDQFNDKNFQEICHRYPEKRIFWICLEWENNATKFMLQEIYNPKFYLKRKFKNVIIKKDLKEHLIKVGLSEIFIFHCVEDKQELYNYMRLNEREKQQFENSCMIKIFSEKSDAEADFELSEQEETVHLLEFKEKQIFWCDSHGLVKSVQGYIDQEQSEIFLIEEDKLIERIKDRKVVIFADDPGMGKTTTLIKLYETDIQSSYIIKSHWIIGIKLRDYLEAVRDLELKTDGIGIVNVVEFLSKIDLKLNNNLSKTILITALDKTESFQAKPLLLVFDGFDEVLHVGDRNRILLLLKFIKNETAAKLWITTRCHFKKLLEETLSTIAIQFSPMDDAENAQYIATYLQHRLYLTLNNEIYTDLFDTNDKKQNNEKIQMYTTEFIKKMKSIFRSDIATFIGTPLQLHLMLEDSEGEFKNWIEKGGGQTGDFNYAGQDVYEVYENFTYRKYGVYFQKVGIPEGVKKRSQEKNFLDHYHKDFAKFRILESKQENSLDEFSYKILLAGIIKSDDSNFQFIHKTFEEFFAAKVVIHWIEKVPNKFSNTNKQEYLLKVILMKSDYHLIRIFMNLQLQKMKEGEKEKFRHNKRLKHYGNIAATMHNEQLLFDEDGKTPLDVAVEEGNKSIACFLLDSLRGQPVVLTDFLFNVAFDERVSCTPITPLHLACKRDDVEIVKVLLEAAAGISEDTLQDYLTCLGVEEQNALTVAARYSSNVQIFNELLSRSNNKLDLILNPKSALCIACSSGNEEFVEFLLEGFKNEDSLENGSLKKILLHNDEKGNALCCSQTTTIVEKLIDAAKSMKDNKETLKNLLCPTEGILSSSNAYMYFPFPTESPLPLNNIVSLRERETVQKLLNAAEEIGDDTLKQLLLHKSYKKTPLHVAAMYGLVDIINLLLETASNIDIEILEKLITAVDEKDKNAIELMFQYGHGEIFANSFKILQQDKYENIRKKVKEMYDNVRLEISLHEDKTKLIMAIESGDIQKVKDILSNAKNSSLNPNERLRILLLSKNEWGDSTLHTACKKGTTEIMKELLSYAKEMDDDSHTLKQLLLYKRNGESALHVAAENGHVNIMKLLLEKASGLGIDILKELIFRVNEKGKNAILLIAEHGHESFFAASFKMLKDEHPIIWEKVKEMYDNIPFESTLYSNKETLITAIERGDIETVKDILNKVKNSSVNPNESLRFLLLSKNECGNNTLHTACQEGNTEIMKELFSYAKEMDDDNHTLKQLLLHERFGRTPLHVAAEHDKVHIINLLLETASNIDIEILEKLITAVDVKGKNAIELMFQYCHGDIFVDSFKMLQEDKYENIRKKVKKMLDNVPLEKRLYWDKKKLIMAIESGDIQKVKDILSNAKNSSVNTNESLRILLLSKNECEKNTLYIACKEGNTEIMKELLSYAKEMDDDNHTLKQLLLLKRNGKSALHVAAEKGHVNITKLLLETASALDIDADNHTLKQLLLNEGYEESALHVAARWGHADISKLLLETASCLGINVLEELIFGVNEKGKNAIQLIAERGHKAIFAESFKMLEDEHPIIWEKVMKIYDNIPFERTLYSNKKKLIMAIKHDDDTKKVTYILNKVKNCSVNPNESLRFLLLSQNKWGDSTLYTACENRNTEIMKELLTYAMNMDDDGSTLKKLLTKPIYMSPQELKPGYPSEIKQIVDSLIVEARNNNRHHAINILEQINNQYSEEIFSSEESNDVLEELDENEFRNNVRENLASHFF